MNENIKISKSELKNMISQEVNKELRNFFTNYQEMLQSVNYLGDEILSREERDELEVLRQEESFAMEEVFNYK